MTLLNIVHLCKRDKITFYMHVISTVYMVDKRLLETTWVTGLTWPILVPVCPCGSHDSPNGSISPETEGMLLTLTSLHSNRLYTPISLLPNRVSEWAQFDIIINMQSHCRDQLAGRFTAYLLTTRCKSKNGEPPSWPLTDLLILTIKIYPIQWKWIVFQ